MKTVRVAAVQAAPIFLDADATVEKAVSLIEEAAGNGAEFIAFAEWLAIDNCWVPVGRPPWAKTRERRGCACACASPTLHSRWSVSFRRCHQR